MSGLLIDTSAYSCMVRNDSEVKRIIHKASLIVMSPITIGELIAGFAGGSREKQNREFLDDYLAEPRVYLVEIDADTGERFGLIKNTLKSQGTPIPDHDIWQAALAWQHGYKILTRDAHFSKIPQVMLAR
jgi:tRNA(fMet)-specific endonuclease VapC